MENGIAVGWDDPAARAIIRWDFSGVWTWDDWYTATETALTLRAEVIDTPIVPAIFNFQHHLHPPFTGLLPNLRNGGESMDPRDFVIAAYTSGFVRLMIEVYLAMQPTMRDRVLIADTLDDARQMVAEQLDWRSQHLAPPR